MSARTFDAELVVSASQVLYEHVTSNHDSRTSIAFESTHRPLERLQSAVITLDPVVRVLLGVVMHRWQEFLDHVRERRCLVRHDLNRTAMREEGTNEEFGGRWNVMFR